MHGFQRSVLIEAPRLKTLSLRRGELARFLTFLALHRLRALC
jgi:hypothetical protein